MDAERIAVAGLLAALAAAAVFFAVEGHGLTLLIDDWSFGFALRTDFDLAAFFSPHNGHLVAVPVALTKASLQVFGTDAALPLRLVNVAAHLTAAACLFFLMRPAVGTAAVVPTVLVLFLGAGHDVLIGSHGLPFTISVATGLGAWLALGPRRLGWDVLAAALLTAGIASDGVALPFVLGAAAMIWIASGPRTRLWIVAVPLVVYGLWWLGYAGRPQSEFAIANLATLPAFAFDSLAASLASITGVFATPGSRSGGFDLSAGQALAGGLLAVLLATVLTRGYRPRLASAAPGVALLSLWLLTSGVARAPYASRFLYIDVILLLLLLTREIGGLPAPRRAALALVVVCAVGIAPNVRELTYAADGARVASEVNRATMGAADLVGEAGAREVLLEDGADPVAGQYPDLGFSLERYQASRDRFGAPALTRAQIEAAGPAARASADHFLVRALGVGIVPAGAPPGPLPRVGASQTGGVLRRVGGCLRFAPLQTGAQVSLRLPAGGLWLRPAAGSPVPASVARFSDSPAPGVGVEVGAALGGRASSLELPPGAASAGWRAQLSADQPLLLCAG